MDAYRAAPVHVTHRWPAVLSEGELGFHDDLARIVADPEVRRLAERRAGCRELAEDALHETYWAVARTKRPGDIRDLRAFFCTSLIREINHQRTRQAPVPTQDIEGLWIVGKSRRLTRQGHHPHPSRDRRVCACSPRSSWLG